MHRQKIVGKASVGLLLFLPLVAVGVALALMLTWGLSAQQAAADASSDIEFSITAKGGEDSGGNGCTTAGGTEPTSKDDAICNYPVGSQFDVNMFFDGVGAHGMGNGVTAGTTIVLRWSGAVIGPNGANGKALTHAVPANCTVPIPTVDLGADDHVLSLSCQNLPPPPPAQPPSLGTGLHGTASFNCDSEGQGIIELVHTGLATTTIAVGGAIDSHSEDNATDTITVICTPPDFQIGINVVDATDQSKKLSDSCWAITSIATVIKGKGAFLPVAFGGSDPQGGTSIVTVDQDDLALTPPVITFIDVLATPGNQVIITDGQTPSQTENNAAVSSVVGKLTLAFPVQQSFPKGGAVLLIGQVPTTHDVVGDNGKSCASTGGGIDSPALVDKDPAVGSIRVTIDGKTRLANQDFLSGLSTGFGTDIWTATQTQAGSSSNSDINYSFPNPGDPASSLLCTNLPQSLTGVPPTLENDKCDFTQKNTRLNGIATITFKDKTAGDAPLANQCVFIDEKLLGPPFDLKLQVGFACDGLGAGQQPAGAAKPTTDADQDGSANGTIELDLAVDRYSFEIDQGQLADKDFQVNGPKRGQCDLLSSQKCSVGFQLEPRTFSLDVQFNEVNRKGDPFQKVVGLCVNIDPGVPTQICDGDSNDTDGLANGQITQALVSSVVPAQSITVKSPPGFDTPAAQLCEDAGTPTPPGGKCSLKFDLTFVGIPAVFKMTGAPQNLWLTNQNPDTCNANADLANKIQVGTTDPLTRIPKESIDPKTGLITPVKTAQVVAGVEISFMLKDSLANGEVACIQVEKGSYWANSSCTFSSSGDKQKVDVFCATKKADIGSLTGNLNEMFTITVRVNPVVYSLFTAKQDNGTLVQVLAMNCNLTDQLGHPIANDQCPDGDITIRQLEGDVNRDCQVTAIDQQLLAFRWGTDVTDTLFSQTYDLVDTGVSEINIKDVQFVFGRHNSKCNSQNAAGNVGTSQPPQLPLTKK